jgi:hypothetical protein
MDGPPEAVFAAADSEGDHVGSLLMVEMGLDRPFAAEIGERLREQGLPLPSGLLTVDHLVRELTALC